MQHAKNRRDTFFQSSIFFRHIRVLWDSQWCELWRETFTVLQRSFSVPTDRLLRLLRRQPSCIPAGVLNFHSAAGRLQTSAEPEGKVEERDSAESHLEDIISSSASLCQSQALLVLPFFTTLPEEPLAELQRALDVLVVSHFPMQSDEFAKGSLHRNNYMDCVRKVAMLPISLANNSCDEMVPGCSLIFPLLSFILCFRGFMLILR